MKSYDLYVREVGNGGRVKSILSGRKNQVAQNQEQWQKSKTRVWSDSGKGSITDSGTISEEWKRVCWSGRRPRKTERWSDWCKRGWCGPIIWINWSLIYCTVDTDLARLQRDKKAFVWLVGFEKNVSPRMFDVRLLLYGLGITQYDFCRVFFKLFKFQSKCYEKLWQRHLYSPFFRRSKQIQ